jgi:hypothetical protein
LSCKSCHELDYAHTICQCDLCGEAAFTDGVEVVKIEAAVFHKVPARFAAGSKVVVWFVARKML